MHLLRPSNRRFAAIDQLGSNFAYQGDRTRPSRTNLERSFKRPTPSGKVRPERSVPSAKTSKGIVHRDVPDDLIHHLPEFWIKELVAH